VWHDRSYEPSEDGARHYSDRHVHDPSRDSQDEKCQWGAMMRNENRSRADDYDGRVLDLTGVKLVRDKRNGFVELLLLTRESCYAATEVSPRACKGLVVDDDDVRTPRWDISPTIMNINKVESGDAQAKPMVTLVTAFGALILDEADEEGIKHSLVLCRRASGLRNGSDVLSITGGGVINLSIEGMPGDEDSQGFPDPTAAVLRELQEELGIRLERSDAVPISVHVINQRGPSTSVGKSGKGELVATAAFVVHLPMTLAQLREQRVHASSHSGLYESAGLVQIHLPSLIGQKGDSDEERKNNAACAFAIALKANAGELDQQAIIAALYASAAHYSIAATVKAFATVWRRPWYEFAWSNELEKTKVDHDRLARPLDLQLDLISRARVSEVDHFIRNT
jgi:8-oxo-dGTP pyrophosphatase MutT (NUDIX family)